MVRSSLRNKFLKYKTPDLDRAFKKQRNYTNKLLKKEKKRYLSNLDMKNITDNKKFWQTILSSWDPKLRIYRLEILKSENL